ncbi:3'5'-cyclic AMP phosphodiesterase CpdA [Methanonatronarchaeum thermophilum]|uniref:3'5'-cyclic AMP phosphodiesterase CpdA n=1 Tax=Methanonatronarchaeum thermophilum TaxID=1927129 RepID=A0A1Y3GBB0_9EURY|nr:metallophosphoesterase [Methanonatronarchaeum thermophilum]OUJ18530.1 3'5'-cyclic AMP phosphodiesterase CpdA [Methanonatronarchaeum thermophilum]
MNIKNGFIGLFGLLCLFGFLFGGVQVGYGLVDDFNDNASVDDIEDYRLSFEVSLMDELSENQIGTEISWWIAADTHLGHTNYQGELQTAVEDINTVPTDYAVILGDLVHDGSSYVAEFDETMNKLDHNWSYILGNHDFDSETNEPVKEVNYFSEIVNGVQVIGISDEDGDQKDKTVVGPEQDQWLRETLEENSSKPTIIMSHHCPIDREVTSFEDWLGEEIDEYNVVLWISGHAHKWDYQEDIDGFDFDRLKITSIYHWGWGGAQEEQSIILSFEGVDENTSMVHVDFRDHNTGEWLHIDDLNPPNLPFVIAMIIAITSIPIAILTLHARSNR